jgi:hypothetical protein
MVKKKKKENNEFTGFRNDIKSPFKTIKVPLKKILHNYNESFPTINYLVIDINELMIHSYQFIRLYLLYLYTNNLPFPNIDEKFILYSMKTLGTKGNRGSVRSDNNLIDNLYNFYITEYKPLVNHHEFNLQDTSNLTPDLAVQILTSYSNNIQERFIQHFRRFVNETTENITIDKSILFKFKNNLLQLQETDPVFDEWKNIHLKNIFPDNIQTNIHYDLRIENRVFLYLKGMFYMNSVLETQGKKLFQVLPLRTDIIPKNIPINTASAIKLILEYTTKEKINKILLLSKIKENQHYVWNNILNLNHKIFRNNHYQFHYQIQTDGISCSLLFIRKDLKDEKRGSSELKPIKEKKDFYYIDELSKDELDKLKDRKIIGCDPGKGSMVYMMDEEGNKLRYTVAQKRRESKAKRNQHVMLKEKKKNKIIEEETLLSSHNSKSVDYEKFKSYLVEKVELNRKVRKFYRRDTWRKMKFRHYSYSMKSIDKFLNKIKSIYGDNLLIGYGNWGEVRQMKHCLPSMSKGLRKIIHKKFDTISIDEYNTSKKCCVCHNYLNNFINSEGKKEWRLLYCSKCVSCENKKVVFRTRDANSAFNMLKLTKLWIENQTRPSEFLRNFVPTSYERGLKCGPSY